MDTATTSTARDPPMLSPPLSLKPMLMLTTDTDTVILDMLTTDTTAILMPTMDSTATTDMLTTDITDIPMLMDMDTATTTARDPLMPSPDMDILDMLTTDITAILMPTVVTTDMAIIINLFDYLLRVEDC